MRRHPVKAAASSLTKRPKTLLGPNHVHIGQAEGIAGPNNGRQVSGFVHLIRQHPQVGLTGVEDLLDSGEAFGSHK